MKSLVEDIQASRDARTKSLGDIQKDTRHILGDAKSMLKDFAKDGAERAQDIKRVAIEVKSFLNSSREARKQDFEAMMKTVHTSLADVKKDSTHARHAGKTIIKDARALLAIISKDNKAQAEELHEELKKSDHHRKAEFQSMMGDIQEDLQGVKNDSDKARKDAKNMVSRYHHSRMSAQKHWASLSAVRSKTKQHEPEE